MHRIRPTAQRAIIEAGFETFSRKPGASLADVAACAGVGRATLHRHFRSRDDLMVALAHAAMAELNAAVEAATADVPTHADGLKQALVAIIPLADRQWFLAHEPVEQDPEIAAAYARDRTELAREIDAAKTEGAFARDVPTQWIAESYENLIYVAWTLVRNGDVTVTQAANLAWRTLTTGLEENDH